MSLEIVIEAAGSDVPPNALVVEKHFVEAHQPVAPPPPTEPLEERMEPNTATDDYVSEVLDGFEAEARLRRARLNHIIFEVARDLDTTSWMISSQKASLIAHLVLAGWKPVSDRPFPYFVLDRSGPLFENPKDDVRMFSIEVDGHTQEILKSPTYKIDISVGVIHFLTNMPGNVPGGRVHIGHKV